MTTTDQRNDKIDMSVINREFLELALGAVGKVRYMQLSDDQKRKLDEARDLLIEVKASIWN